MMRKPSIEFGTLVLLAALAALLVLPAGLAAAATAARVTAALGNSSSGDDPLALRGGLEDGADVQTGEDGECSLLVDGDAVMEVCGDTLLSLERKAGDPDGARIVKLDRGSIRLVVEPRLGEEKIEIHTPAAIATVLGTIVHVSVSALGVVDIISETSNVLIETRNQAAPARRTIASNEKVTIGVDGDMSDTVQITPEELREMGGCLVGFGLHETPLKSDRAKASDESIEEAALDDGREAAKDVALGPAPGGPPTPPADPIDTNPPFTPVDTTSPMMSTDESDGCFPGETTCP